MSDAPRGLWMVETLKEHTDVRFTDLKDQIAESKRMAERADDSARHAVERAEDMAQATRQYTEQKNNEFRGQLADQASTFLPRIESDSRNAGLQRQLDENRVSTQKSFDELRRLVWIGVGLAIAASVAIPLLLKRQDPPPAPAVERYVPAPLPAPVR